MQTFLITAITKNPSSLTRKMQRHGYDARVYKKTNVIAAGNSRPWAILNGYNTIATQVVPLGEHPSKSRIDDAIATYGI